MTITYIAVGSNLGNREKNIQAACRLMEQSGISIRHQSPLYKTESLTRNQETAPPYLNGVLEIETQLAPPELLATLRTAKRNWQPRTIDLDILFYGNEVIVTPNLKIPHPEIPKRWFVLRPMADLNQEWLHPVLKKSIKELLQNIPSPL
ncbi:MAG: 2-amino-4-hydroxy-6-hydroxymethyldihydropteridine diphosphokinase [Deltaproteobacteria bacterium]|nr:2-amino-4-hydroxy-6-hydroxymethyldihydropteridine diphosphokinase [Deltaproteobacteria bacterium]